MALRPAWRDALLLVAVFGVLLGGLYAYTGSWPPAVIVESGSMMHADSEVTYGRSWLTGGPATIDPGDLVLVRDVQDIDDVVTQVEGGRERYGKPGDVVVYYPANNRAKTPIIHRAVAYVVVEGQQGSATYWVRWDADAACEGGATKVDRAVVLAAKPESEVGAAQAWCQYGSDGIYIPSVPVQGHGSTPRDPNPYKPLRSGFMTKGDNPVTNTQTDQLSQLSVDARGNPVPVQIEWIEGKGRAELPWLGLIKLAVAGRPNELNPPLAWTKVGWAYAPKDLWVMLGVSLFLLVGVPLIYDGFKAYSARELSRAIPPAPGTLNAQAQGHASVHLSWAHVQGAHNYRVYRGDERVAMVRDTHFTDMQLAPGTAYTYTVSAVNELGTEGARSSPVVAHTTPAETA